jgi:hypothetical protein
LVKLRAAQWEAADDDALASPRTDFKLRRASYSAEQQSNDSGRDQGKVQLHNRLEKRRRRAPHKPLLALYAIGRVLRGEPRMVPYAQVDRDLGKLLMEFGPRQQPYHPEYPFWRLQNDELWEITNAEGLTTRRGNTDAKKSELLEQNVAGGFPPEVQQELSRNKRLASDCRKTCWLQSPFPHQHAKGAVWDQKEWINKIRGASSFEAVAPVLAGGKPSASACFKKQSRLTSPANPTSVLFLPIGAARIGKLFILFKGLL